KQEQMVLVHAVGRDTDDHEDDHDDKVDGKLGVARDRHPRAARNRRHATRVTCAWLNWFHLLSPFWENLPESAPSSNAAELLDREHQARGRTRSRPRLAALARASVHSGAAWSRARCRHVLLDGALRSVWLG